jgi:hypothetical protein
MARIKRAVFNPLGPFVVRVAFRFGGALLAVGEPFKKALTERRLRVLYDARRLDLASEEVETVAVVPVVVNEVAAIDWRNFEEKELLAYAFEKTGSRFRNPVRAAKALEDLQ